jgi:hypothetical protein
MGRTRWEETRWAKPGGLDCHFIWVDSSDGSVRSMAAGVEGLEPPTAGFGDQNSSQLSYTPMPLEYT